MEQSTEEYELDPVFVHSLREAKWILKVFCVFALYTVGYCYLFGFPPKSIEGAENSALQAQVLGMPSWVWWGIVVPWLAANLVTAWFCFGKMQYDSLEDEQSGSHPPQDSAEVPDA